MRYPHMKRALALAAMLVAGPRIASAQADPDAVKRHNNCRLARQVLETGVPAPRTQWALSYIGYCDTESAAAAVIAGIRRLRNSDDVSTLQRLFAYAVVARTSDTFRELLEIAGDRSASVPARVVALLKLNAIRTPHRAPPAYKEVIGGLDEQGEPRGRCHWREVLDAATYSSGSLPLDYRESVDRLNQQLRSDSSEHADLRSAAACM